LAAKKKDRFGQWPENTRVAGWYLVARKDEGRIRRYKYRVGWLGYLYG